MKTEPGDQNIIGRAPHSSDPRQRLHCTIRGAVQGVGFRPFVYRLATSLQLQGWVKNTSQGVFIEVEGPNSQLREFQRRLRLEKPPRAMIQSMESSVLDPEGYSSFCILESEEGASRKTVLILPDIATCPECLQDILTPGNRRYRYPFTNCTNCGPRYSIIQAVPYDRRNTTMRHFRMCAQCQAEYEDPGDRRFHAQPNACLECGPRLELWDCSGFCLSRDHDALLDAGEKIRKGEIVAVKGLGGFHLMADARNEEAVRLLRQRKQREEKPFALMMPSLEVIMKSCEVSSGEEILLTSPESPIVLLRRKASSHSDLCAAIAPRNPWLGVMLPYTPLHHLLMRELNFPVIATSGNLSDEPICTDEREALDRLGQLVDSFLVHNRPIARHVDDSIVRILLDRELVLRRARGYAPLPVSLNVSGPPLLAVGAHLKNCIAVGIESNVFVSQHIGDLETPQAFRAFQEVVRSFQSLYEFVPEQVVCDLHPDYLSTRYAAESGIPSEPVQHHYAHVASCMAENQLEGEVLGVSWDGTGYGPDQTIWGGEFLRVNEEDYFRWAHFRTFPLPGGDRAVKEPRRTALGLLYAMAGADALEHEDLPPFQNFSAPDLHTLKIALKRRVNTPFTSSAGRLFDAAASLAGLRQTVRFEGQAAMELEFSTEGIKTEEAYPITLLQNGQLPWIIDWTPLFAALIADQRHQVPMNLMAVRFHNALVESILKVAERAGLERVALTGGCFQNRYLTEKAVLRLRKAGFRPYWHQRIPPNDGGIALGQIFASRKKSHGPGARKDSP